MKASTVCPPDLIENRRTRRASHWIRFGAMALFGAALIHVTEYHIGLGFDGSLRDRFRTVAYMVANCPMRDPLMFLALAFFIVAILTASAMSRQMDRLRRLDGEPHRRAPVPSSRPGLTFVWPRFAGAWLALAAAQTALFGLSLHVVPMDYVMQMHGGHMLMAAAPPIPVAPLSLVLAGIGAALLSLVAGRLAWVENAIAERLTALFAVDDFALRLTDSPQCRILAALFGPALLSRPPPANPHTFA